MNKTPNPDGKIHRHPEGGYYIQCATLLDDKPAVVTFRIRKGYGAYWATEATVRYALEDAPSLPVFATPHGSRVVKNGFTKREAAEVYRQVREGYVSRGKAAYGSRFAPAADWAFEEPGG